MNVDDRSFLIEVSAFTYHSNLEFENLSEVLKTEILSCRTTFSSTIRFLSVLSKGKKQDDVQTNDDDDVVDNHQSFSTAEIDAIIGHTYTTRGVKRSYEEDSIPIEPNRNKLTKETFE